MSSIPDSVIGISRALLRAYSEGFFGTDQHERIPELREGSREFYLYLTLAPALNFQRNSDSFWRAALATWEDPETRFVFYPENTSLGLEAYRSALTRHGLAVQPNKHTAIWWQLSETLRSRFDSDPRVFIKSAGADVSTIRETMLDSKREFPYLSGPKLSNYWLYLLDYFTDTQFVDRAAITIVPDSHVIGASVRIGLVDSHHANAIAVAEAWRIALKGSRIAPCDLHAPLWRWSRAGFPSVDEFVSMQDIDFPPADSVTP